MGRGRGRGGCSRRLTRPIRQDFIKPNAANRNYSQWKRISFNFLHSAGSVESRNLWQRAAPQGAGRRPKHSGWKAKKEKKCRPDVGGGHRLRSIDSSRSWFSSRSNPQTAAGGFFFFLKKAFSPVLLLLPGGGVTQTSANRGSQARNTLARRVSLSGVCVRWW